MTKRRERIAADRDLARWDEEKPAPGRRRRRVLLVADGPSGRATSLRAAGFCTVELADEPSALRIASAWLPEIVIIDSGLEGVDALGVLHALKQSPATYSIPVILLAGSGLEDDRVDGLERGADECLDSSCSDTELVARIEAILRRVRPSAEVLTAGSLRLDLRGRRVVADGMPVALRSVELRLLHFFMSHAEVAYTRSELIDEVWKDRQGMHERTVDVHITRLRAALAPAGCDRLIQTVRTLGYRFSARHMEPGFSGAARHSSASHGGEAAIGRSHIEERR